MTVQASELMTPYSTVTPFASAFPTWMTPYDAERITAYQIFEQIYWSVPETFKLQMRGSDADPIYIPTARTIIDTTNRYVGKDFGFIVDPDVGTPQEQLLLHNSFLNLFRRERFWSTFASNKRFGIMRGDWCFHVLANPAKPAGSRIKIEALDPGAYFPVFESDVQNGGDPNKVVAVHIVEQITVGEDTLIKRQTYTKGADPATNDGSDVTIWNSIGYFDIKAWESLKDSPVTSVKEPTALPPQIKSIPVYHIRNIETPGDPFGSSEIRGVERVIAAVNQAISDEELALALEGLGMYATDGGPPKDEQGNTTDWFLGPGAVVEHAKGSKWQRINGVSSVQPVMDHLGFLVKHLKEATGTPDIAIGNVDVSVAESGIALSLKMGPMLSKVGEKEQVITDVMRQFYYDLSGWLEAYEAIATPARAEPSYGAVLPPDDAARVKEIMEMVAAAIAPAEWGRIEIAKIRGYVFPEDAAAQINSEAQARAVAFDAFAGRMAAEVDTVEGQEGAAT